MSWKWKLAGIILVGMVGFVAVKWLIIKFQQLIQWFRDRAQLKNSDRSNLAFTLKDCLDNGDYVVYQGIFNQDTCEVVDGQKVISSQVDQEFVQYHSQTPLVVYN